jgi:hypothetical protein
MPVKLNSCTHLRVLLVLQAPRHFGPMQLASLGIIPPTEVTQILVLAALAIIPPTEVIQILVLHDRRLLAQCN